MISVKLDPHPSAHVAVFESAFPRRLGDLPSPESLVALLQRDARAPLQRDEAVRKAVRDVLRHGGYKPTGRGKPASEYLARAAENGALRPINLAADACNVVSLHSGLPISVVDAKLLSEPLRVGIAAAGASFVFNSSGQVIDVSGLLCLHDAEGPCADAVKDAQRTKTHQGTTHTLSIIWGARDHSGRVAAALEWYRALLHDGGVRTDVIDCAASE